MQISITYVLLVICIAISSCGQENTKHVGTLKSHLLSVDTLPKISSKFNTFSTLDASIAEAKKVHKNILLYFTGDFCVYARDMESIIFTDESIKSTLSKDYVAYEISVDDDTALGKSHANFQQTLFGANTLPFFVILDETGHVIKTSHYTSKTTAFKDFLK